MDGGLLVAAHLSSLFPSSQSTAIPIKTRRQKTPLPPPPKETDPVAEHASYSSILHTPTTGTILLRVLHGGLIIELISLSTEVPPIRFVFPAIVLSFPAIFLWGSSELHVLAVTTTGSLYRLVLPVGNGHELWQNHVHSTSSREYLIKNMAGSVDGLVHVQGTHCVAIGLSNGSLLRMETECLGYEDNDDEWSESVVQHGSFLSSLTSFLPTLNPGASNGSEIVSMATHPWPTDIGHIWTLSRDRNLRFWKAKLGCVATKTLSLTISARGSTPITGAPANDSKPHVLLDAEHRTLLRVFTTNSNEEHIYVLVFIPTASSTTSGGSFQLLDTFEDQLHEIRSIECSQKSAHCHLQDFMVIDTTLYTLWDRQGQSMVETTRIRTDSNEQGFQPTLWQTASYAQESELTPAYLEELLLSPGSLTDKFFEAVMRPGMFSALTLRTALDQYVGACLSLPGPPPPQLKVTYATLGENIAAVVGCTVNLLRDPHTGALQHAKYWNALKRDWEGFIARCREVERSARWPLMLGAQDQGDIMIVERERVGSLVAEDLPIHLHRLLAKGHPHVEAQYDLLDILWSLRTKLGPRFMLNLENRLVDIMHQEIAFSFTDILQDQARRSKFKDEMDQGLASWIVGRLQRVDNIDAATRTALDVIGGFDMEIKREEEEVELLLPPAHSDWSRALTAMYITTTVNARYDLCLSLMTLLFFLSDDLRQWDPSLLAEIFAVFRGVAMLRFVSRQPARNSSGPNLAADDSPAADDVISRLRNMQVSRNRTHFTPTYSLIHLLLAQSGDTHGLLGAAHRFLDVTGLLQSVSPAYTTKFEVLFCEKLRLLGYYDAAREMLSWLPRTPGVTYVLARLWLDVGRADDASYLMEKLAGSFGNDNALSSEDQEALTTVLPATELFGSEFSFYLHASMLFKSKTLVQHEVLFAQLALSVTPPGVDTVPLWHSIIKGQTDLGLYENAYSSLIATPHDKQRRECVGHIIYRMCEENAAEKLMTFNFAAFADEVEDALSFKARNVDPRLRPCYSRILYTWYVFRGDYRNAALTMYQRARKLHHLISDAALFFSLVDDQLEAYMVAMNALSLLDKKNAWILFPVSQDHLHEPRKRQKLSKHIPETKYSPGKRDTDIVHLADMQYDYALLSAQLDIIRSDPALLSSADFLLPPSSLVLRLAQSNRFNMAMTTARSLKVDMTDLFTHLTTQCLRLSRNPDAVIQEDTSDWLLTDKVSSWSGTPADRGWRYLRQSLERHDGAETDYKYTKATLKTVLGFDRSSSPPPWLVHLLEENHHEYLIRLSLRYENIESAIEYTLSLLEKTDAKLARDPPQNASSTWLPYTLIDQILITAATQNPQPPRLAELRSEIASRVKRMHKLSRFSQ